MHTQTGLREDDYPWTILGFTLHTVRWFNFCVYCNILRPDIVRHSPTNFSLSLSLKSENKTECLKLTWLLLLTYDSFSYCRCSGDSAKKLRLSLALVQQLDIANTKVIKKERNKNKIIKETCQQQLWLSLMKWMPNAFILSFEEILHCNFD